MGRLPLPPDARARLEMLDRLMSGRSANGARFVKDAEESDGEGERNRDREEAGRTDSIDCTQR